TEHWDRSDRTFDRWWSWYRLLLPQSLVRPDLVVETDVFRNQPMQVLFGEDENVIQELSPKASCKPLSEGIHVRRPRRGSDDARSDGFDIASKFAPNFASRSQTRICGAVSSVAFRTCCAHHASLGA